MKVIYIRKHDCQTRQREIKPSKADMEGILQNRPTITTRQLQIEKVREALLTGKDVDNLTEVAMTYSNLEHIEYPSGTINKEKRPGGSEIEAIRLLRDDFIKRGIDKHLILHVGKDIVVLSSEEKIRLGGLITLGVIEEPVSLDGCESLTTAYTEIELTTYNPVIRRIVKLASMFAEKPGENSENVKILEIFDAAVNKVLSTLAEEQNLNFEEFDGRGLDPHYYVGDEGRALW